MTTKVSTAEKADEEKEETKAEETEKEAEETTVEETEAETTVDTELEFSDFTPVINSIYNIGDNYFYNGKTIFRTETSERGDYQYFFYDIANDKIYPMSDEVVSERDGIFSVESMCKNIAVMYVYSQMAYNIETGETLYRIDNTAGEDFCYMTLLENPDDNDSGIIPVAGYTEAFSGNTYRFGIIDDNGEWAMPITETAAICNYMDKNWQWIALDKENIFMICYSKYKAKEGTSIVIYNWKNDTVTDLTSLLLDSWEKNGLASLYAFMEDNCFHIPLNDGLFKYNMKTGEYETLPLAYDPYEYDKKWNLVATKKDNLVLYKNGVYNLKGDLLAQYDISMYDDVNIFAWSDKKMCFTCSKDGNNYICIMNPDGSFAVEPFQNSLINPVTYLAEDKLVCPDRSHGFVVYFETGEIRDLTDDPVIDDIYGYDETTDMVFLHVKDSDGNYSYCLADADDLDTHINPFE